MTHAEVYAAMVAARDEQQARIRGPQADRWGGNAANRFRMDPRRPLGPNLEMLASYLAPDDILVDVGGGAGRIGLPLALHCKELINVETSPGMQAAFKEVAAEAGIGNVRSVESDWLRAQGVEGDVCLTVHVTYFIRDIIPFIQKLEAAARKRVIICINSVPIPNAFRPSFEVLHGEPQCPVPGYRELLPVLWDVDILPEVLHLPEREDIARGGSRTKEDAIRLRLNDYVLSPEERERSEQLLYQHFNEVFTQVEGLYVSRPLVGTRGLLITWETARR